MRSYFNKNIKNIEQNMFDIGYKINEVLKQFYQATYNTYLLLCRVIMLDQCEINLNISKINM